jgi:(2Fe-2S) ferredoxin
MSNNEPNLRIFACMKTRQDGRPACGNAGAAEILTAIRLELARRGQSAAHIDVRPCGCIDRCKNGPVLVGFTGAIAEAPVPPKNLIEKIMHRPKVSFERVSVEDVQTIVDRLIGVKK